MGGRAGEDMTSATILVAAAVLAIAGLLSAWFVGCLPDPPSDPRARVTLQLSYDPTMTIAGTPVSIERVEFVVHRENAGGVTLDGTQTLLARTAPVFSTVGWGVDPADWWFDTRPEWGDWILVIEIPETRLVPERWLVHCNAFRKATDTGLPVHPAATDGGVLETLVDQATVIPFKLYPMSFELQPDGTIKAVQTGSIVVLSFTYTNVGVTVARVRFGVTIDGGTEMVLELTPTSPMKVPFAGGEAAKDVASHAMGTWQATVSNPTSGSWVVRCEAWTAAGNLRFPSGAASMPTTVQPPSTTLFGFTVKQGKAEPA